MLARSSKHHSSAVADVTAAAEVAPVVDVLRHQAADSLADATAAVASVVVVQIPVVDVRRPAAESPVRY